MKVKLPKFTITTALVSLMLISYVMGNSYAVRNSQLAQNIFDVIDTVALLFLVIMIMFSTFRTRMFLITCGIVACLVVCYVYTRQSDLIRAVAVVLALKNMPSSKVFRLMYCMFLLSSVIIIIMYITGVSDAGVLRRESIGLGFATTNLASRMIQTLVFLWTLSNPSIKERDRNIVYFLIALFTYVTTGSRMTVAIIVCYPLLIFIVKKLMSAKRERIIVTTLCLIPPLFCAIALGLTYLYKGHIWVQELNEIFSNRIYMNLVAVQKYGYSFLGQTANISMYAGIFDPVSNKHINFLTIDCQYLYFIVYYGLLGAAISLGSMMAVIRKGWKNKNAAIVATTILLCLYSFTETIGSIFGFPVLMYLLLKDDKNSEVAITSERGKHYA